MTESSPPPPTDRLTAREKFLGAVGGVQALALGVTRQATEYAADHLPPLPGFPGDVLDAPTQIVDKVFESVEDLLEPRSTLARDVVHQQGTFVRGIFSSLEPIVDALSDGNGEDPVPPVQPTPPPSPSTSTSTSPPAP